MIHNEGEAYSSYSFALKGNYKIISADELLGKGESKLKTEYQVGDKIVVGDFLKKISAADHPEYRNGEKFVVIDSDDCKYSQVVELEANDKTSCPYFKTSERSMTVMGWHRLAELPKVSTKTVKKEKPVVSATTTVYSDGVEVSEETLKFDGKEYTRTELKGLVSRYQEVLRRPVAQVAVKAPAKKVVKKASVKKTTK